MAGRWVDVAEAARELDISTDAVRKRIARGSLESARENRTVRVWLDDGGTEAGREAQVDGGPLVEMLTDQVVYLRSQLDQEREANRENRRIIAALTQRIPEIEAPREVSPEPPESPTEATEQPGRKEPQAQVEGAQEGAEPRSWWRRFFDL